MPALSNQRPTHRHHDEIAAYGFDAMIVGKVAANADVSAATGFFLLKMKNLPLVAAIGIAALLKKPLGREKASDEAPR